QRGILELPPDHALLAALELQAADAAAAWQVLERLQEVVRHELRSELADPTSETGELGFQGGFDRYRLTITLGLGAGAFDRLGHAPNERPQDLQAIDWIALGDASADGSRQVRNAANGDLLLQVCSDSI